MTFLEVIFFLLSYDFIKICKLFFLSLSNCSNKQNKNINNNKNNNKSEKKCGKNVELYHIIHCLLFDYIIFFLTKCLLFVL